MPLSVGDIHLLDARGSTRSLPVPRPVPRPQPSHAPQDPSPTVSLLAAVDRRLAHVEESIGGRWPEPRIHVDVGEEVQRGLSDLNISLDNLSLHGSGLSTEKAALVFPKYDALAAAKCVQAACEVLQEVSTVGSVTSPPNAVGTSAVLDALEVAVTAEETAAAEQQLRLSAKLRALEDAL